VIAGVDAGQTGIRAALEGGRLGPQVAGVRRMEGAVGPDEVAEALLVALATLEHEGRLEAVGVGLSGFELAGDADLARIAARLRERVGADAAVAIASDGVTSLLGALGGARPGVVVAAGTGVVTLGHDGAGGWARVDGWGSLLGDDGSGFAVGHAGLRSALRAYDGRPGSSALRAAAEARWGSIPAVPTGILREDTAVSRVVASFAPAVAEAAHAGDAEATEIWRRAGEERAESAAAAAGRLFAAGERVEVARLGNLWEVGALLDEPFRTALADRWPSADVVGAAGTSLHGAVELARPDGPAPVRGLLWRT
jgi:N-acetylglucosamine kinase-like BadF-type ATPase